MNIGKLIRKGRLEPVYKNVPTDDGKGPVKTFIVGYQRKATSRKRGAFTLRKPLLVEEPPKPQPTETAT